MRSPDGVWRSCSLYSAGCGDGVDVQISTHPIHGVKMVALVPFEIAYKTALANHTGELGDRAGSVEDLDSFPGGVELYAAVCAYTASGADESAFGDEEFRECDADAGGRMVCSGDYSDTERCSAGADGAGAMRGYPLPLTGVQLIYFQ